MKKLLTLILTLSVFSVLFAQQTSTYQQALDKAKVENKQLVLQFSGSDWCAPCIKLEKNILNTPAFEAYATKFVWLKVDFPRKKDNRLSKEQVAENEALAERFNPNGLFPLIVFLDHQEEVQGRIKYFNVSPEEYIAKMESLLAEK